MAKVSTNIGLDAELKKSAQELFADFGMDLTTAITLFLKQSVREQRIPFEINADPFYSAENIAELERRVANLHNGNSVLKEHNLIEVDD